MRVSACSADADYFARRFKGKVRVLLDGVELRDVTQADDVAGFVIRCSRDPAGKLQKADDDTIANERLEGCVEIIGIRRDGGCLGSS